MKTILKNLIAVSLLFALTTLAAAQVAEKKVLTLEGARRVVETTKAEAAKLKAPGAAIAVVDDGGNLLALERLDGTFAAGWQISIGKARTAALFKRETKFFEEIIKNGRTAMTALSDSLFTPLQGGVPIVLDGQIIGAIGVSGAASAAQDQELAVAGANALTNPEAGKASVSYFERAKVDAAFVKGAVLFDNSAKYMVHASHRDKAGMVEVHEQDADIIYVLEGSATLVTGGEVIGSKTIAPGEIRGTDVKGGETRTINKGDVIIVPAGTPHWFKVVPGPLNYYVVKAR
ncbi:MAG: heme-binding protein [Acidobacteriota bacterium]|nr:heme-binding protein [Acidobacteriota bacterium]